MDLITWGCTNIANIFLPELEILHSFSTSNQPKPVNVSQRTLSGYFNGIAIYDIHNRPAPIIGVMFLFFFRRLSPRCDARLNLRTPDNEQFKPLRTR